MLPFEMWASVDAKVCMVSGNPYFVLDFQAHNTARGKMLYTGATGAKGKGRQNRL